MYHELAPIGLHEEHEMSILKGGEFLENPAEFSEIRTGGNTPWLKEGNNVIGWMKPSLKYCLAICLEGLRKTRPTFKSRYPVSEFIISHGNS
jgi:hypothetical protein